jgi:mitochondrial fission protein ELM1
LSEADTPVWVLLGQRMGDNNQLLRLAGELGVPFKAIELRYNALHLVPPAVLGASLSSLTPESRAQICPPWPKLVLGIGYRSVPPALAVRRLSGGKAKLVRLGNPRVDPASFDLVITTPQYRVPDRPNVVRLPLGISTAPQVEPTREESAWLDKLPRPHRLLLIGGDTFMWSLRPGKVAAAAARLASKPGGSVIAVSSGRSSAAVLDAVAAALKGSEHALVWGRFPRYALLLHDADETFVTADSVAMLSDATATGKPVGLIEPDQNAAGRFFYALNSIGITPPVRDIRRFWAATVEQGLAGSVDDPLSGKIAADPLSTAAEAVRALL